ncbi:hypothetical protein QYE76_039526 [Lolium multiflorum]|uniref:CCHC-type domain-containing protein n=1 Tax=Lolium multiflorum TaxID=4521 RepID=A0AAD8WUK3_LOLMU|nr:hypothetical protein QYE76_039526 [Lolium multiflorum]
MTADGGGGDLWGASPKRYGSWCPASGAAAWPGPARNSGRAQQQQPRRQSAAPTQPARTAPASGDSGSSKVECFRCGRPGHFLAGCTADPICVICGKEGHFSADCPGLAPSVLCLMGQAISGEGFFYLDFDEGGDEETEASNAAVLSFDGLPLSARDLEAELHHLIGIDWDWKVTQVAAKEFTVLFPSQDCLRMSARSGKLFFPLSNSTANIKLADADPAPAELQEVWVTISGLPRRMRRADRLLKGMRMLGRPIEVDLDSLTRRAPVRMRIACRNPSKLHGLVQLFHKNEGFNVGIRVEQPPSSSSALPPAPPRNDDDNNSMGEDDDHDSLGDKDEWRRLGEKDKDKQAAAQDPAAAGNSTAPAQSEQAAPADVPAPADPILDQYGSNLPSSAGRWPLALLVLEKQRSLDTPPTTTLAQQQLAVLEGIPTSPPGILPPW